MTNLEISSLLRKVAASYDIKNEKKYHFQIVAYQKASDIIEHLPNELEIIFKENKLTHIQGIGASIKSHLEELFKTGKVKHFDEVTKDIPESVFKLLDIPGFGPKKANKLVSVFKLTNRDTILEDLLKKGEQNEIAKIPGFGDQSQKIIMRAIQEYGLGQSKSHRMTLPYALALAERVVAYLKTCKEAVAVYPLGSLRRKMPTIGDIDIAVATNDPLTVINFFISYPDKERLIEKGDKTASITASSGKQIDLMTQTPDGFGALLQHFTGNKAHNVHLREYALNKGLSLSEYGIRDKNNPGELIKYDTEEKFYNALGLDWIPPEIREDNGEIELAVKHKLPKLVETQDIKGDLHLHSSFNVEPSHDTGKNSMEEMILKALELKYSYIGFSEHNPSISKHNNNTIYEILKKRKEHIDELKKRYKNKISLFSLLEIDILPEGKLALDDKAFELLDAGIVSIHSVFNMNREEMTKRVIKGLSHPKAKILAHPTGRLLNDRPGYELDWEKIFSFCGEHNKALEINAWPNRLDLPDKLIHEVVKKGLKLIINTDSHNSSQMENMEYGIYMARRGWTEHSDILNTKSYNELKEWFNT